MKPSSASGSSQPAPATTWSNTPKRYVHHRRPHRQLQGRRPSRADIVITRAQRAHAAYEGRLHITDRDILLAAELALPHRMKKQPFQDSVLNADQLQSNMRQARAEAEQAAADENEAAEAQGSAAADEKKA